MAAIPGIDLGTTLQSSGVASRGLYDMLERVAPWVTEADTASGLGRLWEGPIPPQPTLCGTGTGSARALGAVLADPIQHVGRRDDPDDRTPGDGSHGLHNPGVPGRSGAGMQLARPRASLVLQDLYISLT